MKVPFIDLRREWDYFAEKFQAIFRISDEADIMSGEKMKF